MSLVLKADEGYYALIIDPSYEERKTHRMRIIAWQFEANGLIRPRTLNPSYDNNTTIFVIEDPSGQVYAYGQDAVTQLRADSLHDWLQMAYLANSPGAEMLRPS